MSEPIAPARGHETRDVSVRLVAWFAVGLALSLVLISFAVSGLFRAFEHNHPSPDAPSRIALHPHMLAPAPQLQSKVSADLLKFEAAEEAKLHSYGWIDKQAGVIRIPIERAMDLIVERGLPTRGPGTQNASGVTSVQMQERKAAATKP
ncbi:MAG: hypothetical protein ACR2NX_08980 [Chthoniobacterales bacterium]